MAGSSRRAVDVDLADLGAGRDDAAVGQGDRLDQDPPNRRVSRLKRSLGSSLRMFSNQMPRVVPQSTSRMISSWATSTSRRVR